MDSATALTRRMDALAAALREAGVDADHVARLLGSAATATMNALLLDAVVEENAHRPPASAREAAEPAVVEIVEQPLRVAA